MKSQIPLLLLAAGTAAVALLSVPTLSPAQAAADEDPIITTLVAEVITQQTSLLENQAKLDEKIAAISEDVRQARLFAARGGKK